MFADEVIEFLLRQKGDERFSHPRAMHVHPPANPAGHPQQTRWLRLSNQHRLVLLENCHMNGLMCFLHQVAEQRQRAIAKFSDVQRRISQVEELGGKHVTPGSSVTHQVTVALEGVTNKQSVELRGSGNARDSSRSVKPPLDWRRVRVRPALALRAVQTAF